jgi:hypothetical protein
MIKTIQTRLGDKEIEVVQHPDFGEIPQTVYKFRDWNNPYHQRMLTEQEIYFASPSEFNDPFDCGIPVAYHLLQTDAQLRQNYFWGVVQTQFRNNSLSAANHQAEVDKLIAQGRHNDNAWLEKNNDESIMKLHQQLGVLCLTPVKDNILMWAHYANSHKGFCIGFDGPHLVELLGGGGGEICYVPDYPEIVPVSSSAPPEDQLQQWSDQIMKKADFWDYEIEYRITKMNQPSRIVKITPDIIKEVILGAVMSRVDMDKIINFLKAQMPHVNVFQAKPKRRAFDVEIVPI